MTSQRWLSGRSEWSIFIDTEPQTELVAQDAARLAANCDFELQMSAAEPGRPPVFAPHRIRFNSLQHPADDFEYPLDAATARAAGRSYSTGTCRTNHHDYDLLVRTVLLSIKHHIDDAFIMPPGTPGEQQWKDAFDLYRRTFPERKVPSLVGWPPEVEQHVAEMEELRRREQEWADANPQPCSICAAAKARAEGRLPEAPPTVPRPSFLDNHPWILRFSTLQSHGDSEQATQ